MSPRQIQGLSSEEDKVLGMAKPQAVGEQVDSKVSYLCSFLPEKFMKQGGHCFKSSSKF